MSDAPSNTFNSPRHASCDTCGGDDKEGGLPFASLVAGWSPTQAHDGARYLVNLCKPCFLMVLGDLQLQRRVNLIFDDTEEEIRRFGMVNAEGPRSITFGEVEL